MPLTRPAIYLGGLAVAAAIHLDWHLARHGADRMSFGFAWHWLIAIPVFAVLTWALTRRAGARALADSAWAIAIGVLLGQVVEPLAEGLTRLTDPARWKPFLGFLAAGLTTWLTTYRFLRRDATTRSWGAD
jgi:hypothetical protein